MTVTVMSASGVTYNGDGRPVLPSSNRGTDWTNTKHGHRSLGRATQREPNLDLLQPGGAVAWDCEGVTLYNELGRDRCGLGRISIVNGKGEVIYDTFAFYPGRNDVRPPPARLNLGVTYRDILEKNGAQPIEVVREDARRIFAKAGVIIGHAIYNDINYLRGDIPWDRYEIRDTQAFPEYQVHAKSENGMVGLDTLAELFLGRSIQSEGHNSVTDAQATVKLYRWKSKEINAQQSRAAQLAQAASMIAAPNTAALDVATWIDAVVKPAWIIIPTAICQAPSGRCPKLLCPGCL